MPNDLTKRNKIGSGAIGFAGRVLKHSQNQPLAETIDSPNRIALMLDNSGSMSESGGEPKSKIELLKTAVEGFLNSCDFSNTAVAMYPIPVEANVVSLTKQSALLQLATLQLDASGGTPLGDTMTTVLENEPITRGVIVSDGEQTDGDLCFTTAKHYRDASIPIDCVHIGYGRGEETLQRIAEMTGGTYIKFKDVSQFAKAMKYLSPRYRALLASPADAKALLGADEVK
jgi:Mg-chelatase subunit ChlD